MTRNFSIYFIYSFFFLISIKYWNLNHSLNCCFFSHFCAASSSLLSPWHPHLPQLSFAHHFFPLPSSFSFPFLPCPVPSLIICPFAYFPVPRCLLFLHNLPLLSRNTVFFFSLRFYPCLFPVLPSPHLSAALSLVLPKLSCHWPIKARGCYFRCSASCRWLSETERDTERRKAREKRMCVRKVEVTPLAAIPYCFISRFPRYFIVFKPTVTPPPSLRSSKPTFSSSSSSDYKLSVPLIISLFTLSLLWNIFLFASKQKYPSSPPPHPLLPLTPTPLPSVL